jgi:E3 ubiquitin-protein ligase HUWE1
LINQIADLLVPGRDVGDSVIAAAVFALDAMTRHRPTDVLTTISAHVSHGIIMNLLRSVVDRLVAGTEVLHETVDSILGFVAYISGQTSHGNLLVAAGLVPVLLQMLDAKGFRRLQYISRACGLLDTAFIHPQALPAFAAADGMNVVVGKIKGEVQAIIDAPLPEATELESQDTIISFNTQTVKAMLRTIYRLLQTTGGTEGFRNVVDTDLPKSIKRIFLNMDKFGKRNFAVATNIMATIVHNEPTSLSILQEMQLPQTLYEVLEKNMPDTLEVIATLPNAIGAICLNAPGLQATLDHFGVIKQLITTTVSLKPEASERGDNVAAIGTHLDELARHHPSLRPKLLEVVLEVLKAAVQDGEAFRPSSSEATEYAAEVSDDMDVEQPAATPATPPSEVIQITNAPLTKITNVLKLLTGVLRNRSICEEFVKAGGLDVVLSVADLPCVPVRISLTDVAVAIPSVLRIMGEHELMSVSERPLAEYLVNVVKKDLEALPMLWKNSDARENWWSLLSDSPANGLEEENARLRRAVGFSLRLSLLAEYLNTNNRTSTPLLKALVGDGDNGSPSDLVPNLGLLHRVMIQEHCIMKQFNMDVEPPSVPTVESAQVTAQAAQAAQPPATAATEGAPETAGSVPAADPAAAPAADATTDPAVRVVEAGSEDDSAVEKKITRASTVKTLVTRFQSILIKFFKGGLRCMCTFC